MLELARIAFQSEGLKGLAQIRQFQDVIARVVSRTRLHSYCGAGKSFVQSDTNGDLYACNWFMTDPKNKIGHNDKIDPIAKSEYDPTVIELNNCQTCWARHFCAGGCMFVHQTFENGPKGKNPQFCDRTRKLGAVALHYLGTSLNKY